MNTPNFELAKERLCKAIAQLCDKERFLLVNDVNERSISHKLAGHLQAEFRNWHVDCEYNRNVHSVDAIKRLRFKLPKPSADDTEARTVYPDIVVHRRGTDKNLLAVEIKKSTSSIDRNHDLEKLELFIDQLGYAYGAFIEFTTDTENIG